MRTGPLLALWFWLSLATTLGGDSTNEVRHESVLPVPATITTNSISVLQTAPNEVVGRRVVYRGILVQLKKADKPWQLLNPFAPARYGRGDENLTRDPITDKPRGFAVFSLKF